REPGMTPYEILLSESQERMLMIVHRGQEEKVKAIFEKWDLPYARVGEVTSDGMMRVRDGGRIEAEIPADILAKQAPVYVREALAQRSQATVGIEEIPQSDAQQSLIMLLAHPTIASKNWVFRQYDHTVRAGTIVPPGSDAAVFYVREANKILAVTSDCNGLYCKLDPREGARIAVAEAARNLVCSGAAPLAVTDNLNFGNPYRPEIFWALREAVEGLAEACRRFNTPVTGGNVSLYNQNPTGAVDPTPTVGMVGIIANEDWITRQYFRNEGDIIFLVGPIGEEMGATHYLKVVHGRKEGLPPRLNFELELRVQQTLASLIQHGFVQSAHDCSEGGIGVALVECCISGEIKMGASVRIGNATDRMDLLLFNEKQSRAIISVRLEEAEDGEENCAKEHSTLTWLGAVGGTYLVMTNGQETLTWKIAELYETWYCSIENIMSTR